MDCYWTWPEALEKLRQGNLRFLAGRHEHHRRLSGRLRADLAKSQEPYASILACSDSRTPPEHIFDAGLGDLFVCRNAGNQLTDTVLGSVEYAAVHLGSPLLVVMGHSSCGAFGAAVRLAQNPELFENQGPEVFLRDLLPAVLAARVGAADDWAWTDQAASRNVDNICLGIAGRSRVLNQKIETGEFKAVGAWYDLAQGTVEFRTYD